MVRRAFTKVVLRQISGSLSRFLSIFAIVALGVGFFAGLKATGPDMRDSGDAYFDGARLMDFRVLSEWGFDETDVDAFRDGLPDAEVSPSWFCDLTGVCGEEEKLSRVFAMPSGVNTLTVVEGRLPEAPGECVVDSAHVSAKYIGKTIALSDEDENAPDGLARAEYAIVGTIASPMYVSLLQYGSTSVGSGKIERLVYIPAENFTLDYYTELYIVYPELAALDCYSDEYSARADELKADIEALAAAQAEARFGEERAAAQAELADAESSLESAKSELADKRAELADAKSKLESADAELSDAGARLDENAQTLAEARARLDGKAKELADAKTALASAGVELAGKRGALAQAKAQLDSARKTLDDGAAEYERSGSALAAGEAALAESRSQLAAGEDSYAASYSEYSKNLAEYDAAVKLYGGAALADKKAALDKAAAELAASRAALDASAAEADANAEKLDASRGELAEAKNRLDLGESDYALRLAEYRAGAAQLDKAAAQLDAKTAELGEGESALAAAEAEWQGKNAELGAARGAARGEYEKKLAEYSDGLAEYADAEKDAQPQFADAESDISEAEKRIADGKSELAGLAPPEQYVLLRSDNPAFDEYGQNSERMENIAKIFPAFFLAVAALVSLTTMTRMVDEERTQIGALSALGYTNSAILRKYMVYALSATALGSIFGVAVGFRLFPRVIMQCYGVLYVIPRHLSPFRWGIALPSVASALAVVAATVYAACAADARSLPAALMRPKAPPGGRRVFLERIGFVWNRLDFTRKVSARNILRYKKRMIMTVVGVAGCTALMLAGFGLRDSISGIVDTQYGELWRYAAIAALDPDTPDALARVRAAALESDPDAVALGVFQRSYTVSAAGSAGRDAYLFVPEDTAGFDSLMTLRGRTTGERYSLPPEGDGAVISEKLSKLTGVSVGDTLIISDGSGGSFSVTVSALSESYLFHYVYMSRECYETASGHSFEPNAAILGYTLEPEAEDALAETMLSDGATAMNRTSTMRSAFAGVMGVFDVIVLVLICSAGLLAFVVLYNLTNINITERIREIATLKVLGFYDREVSMYIFRENIVLTLAGVAVGLLVGRVLAEFVVSTAEIDMVMFGRRVYAASYLMSAALTAVFSLVVSLAMHRRLRNISMTESLKSVE